MPDSPPIHVFRFVVKRTPVLKNQAFYGNYGGLGNRGGKPIDRIDDLFRRHDIVYYEGSSFPTLRGSDELLMKKLGEIPRSTLTDFQKAYIDQAIGYFSSVWGWRLGKPIIKWYRTKETHEKFRQPGFIEQFFDQRTPGFLNQGAAETGQGLSEGEK
ncbi:MAG: hypothetical protein AAF514_12170 [Verrucomicrobiota bacterium]